MKSTDDDTRRPALAFIAGAVTAAVIVANGETPSPEHPLYLKIMGHLETKLPKLPERTPAAMRELTIFILRECLDFLERRPA